MNRANLAIIFGLIFLLGGAALAIFLARGYRVDLVNKEFQRTGILVATSDPDGAQVLINGRFSGATNSTINLKPGSYQIKITKDGYSDWVKTITIREEEVFKTNAFLFPRAADMRPLTVTGAAHPVISPDQTQIVYSVASASAQNTGVWVLDMSGLRPLIGGANLRQIYQDTSTLTLSSANFIWTGDGRQVIASKSGGLYYSLDSTRINPNPPLITSLNQMLKKPVISAVPTTLATAAADLAFSPDETKILYMATAAAWLTPTISAPLPGTNPTQENRQLIPGDIYVYDLKEDRNYQLPSANYLWFSTSRHLITHDDREIAILEYDGTNKAIVYAGPFINGYAFPWPNASKIIILTSLNAASTTSANLYSINLR